MLLYITKNLKVQNCLNSHLSQQIAVISAHELEDIYEKREGALQSILPLVTIHPPPAGPKGGWTSLHLPSGMSEASWRELERQDLH